MRSWFLSTFLLLASAAICPASTLIDTFGQNQATCTYSQAPPYGTCDVIGDPQQFDIQQATFSVNGGLATVMIYVNSGAVQKVNNQLSLGAFSDSGVTLIPGDVFFYNPTAVYDPSDPATARYLQYGIPLVSHGTFIAGDLYSITGNISTETAQQALQDTSDYYRMDEAVLMQGSGAPLTSGAVTVANNGNGTTTGALYLLTVTVPTTSGFLSLVSGGQIGLLFSSADCGNDVIQGVVGAPEPGSALMILVGVVLLAAGRQWRRRTA